MTIKRFIKMHCTGVIVLCCAVLGIIVVKNVVGAPTNETSDLLEEVAELQRNLSDVWQVMRELNDRVDQLEINNEVTPLCDDDDDVGSDPEKNSTEPGDASGEVNGHPGQGHHQEDKDRQDAEEHEEAPDDADQTVLNSEQKIVERLRLQIDNDGEDDDDTIVISRKYHRRNKHHRKNSSSSCLLKRDSKKSKEQDVQNKNVTAYCNMRPNKALPPGRRADVRGRIYLVQEGEDKLIMNVKVSGLLLNNDKSEQNGAGVSEQTTGHKHGFHVHEYGNLTNGCESAGQHYNPLNTTHGGPTSNQRHFGDFGNLESNERGVVDTTVEFKVEGALNGPHSLVGRSLVIHELEDDLGSNPENADSMTTGNAGARLACCIIHKWH